MGRKRKVTKKKKARQDAYIHAIVVMIFSILLAVLIYIQSGYIGEHLSPMLGGLMGWIKYLVPIGTFLIGITLIKEEREFVLPKIAQYAIIILCVCAFITSMQLSSKNKILDVDDDFSNIVSQAYDMGTENKGGGVIGALVAVPMNKMIGTLGTNVVLIGVAILLAIFTFGIKPAELIDSLAERIKESREYQEEEDQEEEEEEIIEPKREKKKDKKKKVHSSIMPNPFADDAEDETDKNQKFEHDIPLAFDEKSKQTDFIEANLFKETEEEKEDKTKQVLQLEHAQVVDDQNYEFPPIALLESAGAKKIKSEKKAIADNALKLQKTLHSFGVTAKVEDVSVGPAITRYELKPAEGVRVSKIANLADDIALNLAAQSIRIEAPIPGKQAVRNRDTK